MLFKKPAVEEKIEVTEVKEDTPKKKEPSVFTPVKKTFIGKGVTFVGNFETSDPIEINGAIDGDIDSSNTVEINQTGTYTGNAAINNLLLHGNAEGKLQVKDLSRLTSTACMRGTLSTSKLVTEEGSSFEGDMKLFQLKPAAAAPKAEPKEEPQPAPKEESKPVPKQESAQDQNKPKLPPLKEDDIEVDEDFLFGKH